MFLNKEEILVKSGIEMEPTVLHNPQQSGIAEKKSRDVISITPERLPVTQIWKSVRHLTQRSKARRPRSLQLISLRSLLKGFKGATVLAMSLIQNPPLTRRLPNIMFGKVL